MHKFRSPQKRFYKNHRHLSSECLINLHLSCVVLQVTEDVVSTCLYGFEAVQGYGSSYDNRPNTTSLQSTSFQNRLTNVVTNWVLVLGMPGNESLNKTFDKKKRWTKIQMISQINSLPFQALVRVVLRFRMPYCKQSGVHATNVFGRLTL